MKVNKSLSSRDGPVTISSTKTRAGRRVVSLPCAAIEALRRHRVRQCQERLSAREWADGDLVFTSTSGTPMNPANFTARYWHPLLLRAQLPSIHFHDLRHTSALMAMRSGHLTAVSRRLGHSNTGITAELYGHSTSVDDERIADRMASMLKGDAPEMAHGSTDVSTLAGQSAAPLGMRC